MPRYDYKCGGCGTIFEMKMSMSDYAAGPAVSCPDCGAAEAERAFTSFGVITGGRGSTASGPAASCGTSGFT
jgi:putative FmdB family regulatory protein